MGNIKISLLFTLALCGCQKHDEPLVLPKEKEPEILFDYNDVKDKWINWDKVFTPQVTDYYVYFYSPICSHCENLKNWIVECAITRGDIYFSKSSEKDIISKDISSSIGVTKSDDLKILGYPSLIEILDKKVVDNCAGEKNIKTKLTL